MNLNQLREDRAKFAADMNAMVELAAKENRELTAEDEEKFNRLDKEQSKLRSLIEKGEKTATISNELSAVRSTGIGREDKVITAISNPTEQAMENFRSYLRFGVGSNAADPATLRALGAQGTGAAGGYLAPSQGINDLVKIVRDLSGVMSAPVKFYDTLSGEELLLPTIDDTANTGNAVDENPVSAIADTNDPTFGQISLKSFAVDSGVVRISNQLLQDSVVPVETEINDALGIRIGAKVNAFLTTGNGTTEPQGITVGAGASSVTLPAATLGADGGVVYQNLQAIIHSVPAVYRKSPAFGFMFNDATLLTLKQMVDDNKRPLWAASMSDNQPDRICGIPYYINSDMEDIGADNISIVIGDFSKFYVRRVMGNVQYLRLNEVYARYLQTGFLCWFRIDSAVANSSAIKYVAHAAS